MTIRIALSALLLSAVSQVVLAADAQAQPCNDRALLYKVCQNQEDLYKAEFAKAQKENKLLLVSFGFERCGWCKPLADLLRKPDFAKAFPGIRLAEIGIYKDSTKLSEAVALLESLVRKAGAQDVKKAIAGFPFMVLVNPSNGKVAFQETGSLEDNSNGLGHDQTKVFRAIQDAKVKVENQTVSRTARRIGRSNDLIIRDVTAIAMLPNFTPCFFESSATHNTSTWSVMDLARSFGGDLAAVSRSSFGRSSMTEQQAKYQNGVCGLIDQPTREMLLGTAKRFIDDLGQTLAVEASKVEIVGIADEPLIKVPIASNVTMYVNRGVGESGYNGYPTTIPASVFRENQRRHQEELNAAFDSVGSVLTKSKGQTISCSLEIYYSYPSTRWSQGAMNSIDDLASYNEGLPVAEQKARLEYRLRGCHVQFQR